MLVTLTAPADSESLSKPSFRLGHNQFSAPAVFPHYRGRVLSVHVEQHINQTLESVDCDGFQYVQESPHERTSFSGPA